jgi:hypothetical protein
MNILEFQQKKIYKKNYEPFSNYEGVLDVYMQVKFNFSLLVWH